MLNTKSNTQFIVTRDGQLDKAFYRQIQFQANRKAFKAKSRELAVTAAKTPKTVLKGAGMLFLYSLEQANQYNKQYN
jgi:hypothetical protein